MLGPRGKLVVKELGLDGNLEEVQSSPPGRGRGWAARQGQLGLGCRRRPGLALSRIMLRNYSKGSREPCKGSGVRIKVHKAGV